MAVVLRCENQMKKLRFETHTDTVDRMIK